MPRRSSKRWLDAHRRDPYVRSARAGGYRSRAVYKLAQIDARDGLLEPGMTVIDLGAAPGGWTQYCVEQLAGRGRVLSLDRLPMEPLAGAEVLQADFAEMSGLAAVREQLAGSPVDLVLSDMAPNLSGVAVTDQMGMMHLAELAFDFCDEVLRHEGKLVVKVFQGEGFDALLADMRRRFRRVAVRKPEASKDASRELYLVGAGGR